MEIGNRGAGIEVEIEVRIGGGIWVEIGIGIWRSAGRGSDARMLFFSLRVLSSGWGLLTEDGFCTVARWGAGGGKSAVRHRERGGVDLEGHVVVTGVGMLVMLAVMMVVVVVVTAVA